MIGIKIVIALGGNALAQKGEASLKQTVRALRSITPALVKLISKHRAVIVHGSGPQAGLLQLQNESLDKKFQLSLDVLDSEIQGQLGYLIEQELLHELQRQHVRKEVVTVITRVVVDKNDAAFHNPTKPIGAFYTKAQALKLRRQGIVVKEDAGRGYRRVVPSPLPLDIIEAPVIADLVKQNVIVIAAGGGGIPVSYHRKKLQGVAAVIDKDLAASLLARTLKADMLLIITSVPHVYLNFHKKNQKLLRKIHLKDAKKYLAQGHFAEGSMAPKIRAAIDFLQHGGKKVVITGTVSVAIARCTGTTIVR